MREMRDTPEKCTLFRSKVISEATFLRDLPCAHLQSNMCVHVADSENRAANFATKQVKILT